MIRSSRRFGEFVEQIAQFSPRWELKINESGVILAEVAW